MGKKVSADRDDVAPIADDPSIIDDDALLLLVDCIWLIVVG